MARLLALAGGLLLAAVASSPAGAGDKIDTEHLRLELRFTDTRAYTGRVVETLRLREAASSLWLDAVGLEIRGVRRADGRPLQFEQMPRGLRIELGATQAADTRIGISIDYAGLTGRGVYAGGPTRERPKLPRQIWTNSWPEDARYWFPCNDDLDDKTTTELVLSVPSAWEATATGALESRTASGKTRTWHWRLDRPISTYLLSFVAGEYERVEANPAGPTALEFLVYRGRADDARKTFAATPGILGLLSDETALPYPFPRLAQAVVADFLFGAMENATSITYGDGALRDARARADDPGNGTIAHEIAHQWWGDTVTPARWADIWLSEGFATYYEELWRERSLGPEEGAYGRLLDADKYFELDTDARARPVLFGATEDPNELLGPLTYERAALVIGTLRRTIGDPAFLAGIRSFMRRYAFRNATSTDFAAAMATAAGRPLDWFFEEWLERPGFPEVRATWRFDPDQRCVLLRLEQPDPKALPFVLDLDVALDTPQGWRMERVFLEHSAQEFSLPMETRPRSVVVDPTVVHLLSLREDKTDEERGVDLAFGPTSAARARAARAFAREGGEAGRAPLAAALMGDPFWGVRGEAARALGVLGGTRALDTLRTAQSDADPRVREAVAKALSCGPASAVAPGLMATFATDPSERVRAAAIESLGTVRADGAWRLLVLGLQRESHADRVRIAALNALASLGSPRGIPLALEMTSPGRPPPTRGAAIKALAALGSGQAVVVARLERLLSDSQPPVRKAAAHALGQLGAAADALRAAEARDDVPAVRREIAKALIRIGGQS
jgi:aminopeptidase N